MPLIESPVKQSIQYPDRTLKRAELALKCSPFGINVFTTMEHQSVALRSIVGQSGIEHQYTRKSVSELAAENHLLWLIQVGVLRREVDGQGLTDSFRLTPLGRQLLDKWRHQDSTWKHPSLFEYIHNFLNRWLRLPFL